MRSYFGRKSDQLGRKRLLIITLLLYLFGTGLAAFTVNDGGWVWLAWFYGTRFIAGMGIGGQYAAINSAIDEMMPSKYRGRVDIWINGSYWAGAILGSFASLVFLNAFAPNVGWRLAFLMGPVLAIVVIIVARTLPESPRWLMTHGRMEEAERSIAKIEEAVRKSGQELEPVDDSQALELTPEKRYGYVTFLGLVFRTYPKRAVLGATLMITQSFLYNAIYFTYGLVLVKFYGVAADKVPLYGLAFAVGNLCGPLILAPLFDSVGTEADDLGHVHHLGRPARDQRLDVRTRASSTATTQTFCWIVIFFFASAGASAAYLTVSETWPIEIRAEAIAVFFAIAQIFGAFGPVFYGCADRRRLRSDRALHRLRRSGERSWSSAGSSSSRSGSRRRGSRSRRSRSRSPRPLNLRLPPPKEANMDSYDVIIIGTGAGGGTLARHLAPSGKRILLLERGDWLPREPQNWSDQDVFVDNRYVSPDTWYDASGKPFQPGVHYVVGGATKMYGAALYRLRKEDFGELQHHDGISPAWPIAYDELEPYYSLAEQHYHVHGARGEDPTEPPASAPYPHPAVSHEPRIQQLADDLAAAGYRPFHAPCGIMLDESNPPFSTCIRCATCDGFPCLVHAKSDAEVLGVRPALEHPNVTLRTNARVVRLETNGNGTAVTEVVVERDGAEERFAGDVVVVACGAANTAKLLLQSASDKHPNGLANGSDQVGRNYMFHDSTAVLALSREENLTAYQKTLGLNDFYFGDGDFEYPLGNVQMVGKSTAPMFRGERPRDTKLAPEWTLERMARHAIDFWLSTEDLPRPENRVTVEPDGNIKLTYTETNLEPKKRLYAKVKSMLGKLDMNPGHLIHRFAYMKNDIPIAGCAHQAGTARFGTDPETSVLDVNCKAHELDNLYVVDTSVFPSIGAVNPALTAMANSLRVGDHLLERLR